MDRTRESFKFPDLFVRITQNPIFRCVLLTSGLKHQLKQLSSAQISELASQEELELQYCAIKASGFSALPGTIDWLKERLTDKRNICSGESKFPEKTISEAAFSALMEIGSPSAKLVYDEWQSINLGN